MTAEVYKVKAFKYPARTLNKPKIQITWILALLHKDELDKCNIDTMVVYVKNPRESKTNQTKKTLLEIRTKWLWYKVIYKI